MSGSLSAAGCSAFSNRRWADRVSNRQDRGATRTRRSESRSRLAPLPKVRRSQLSRLGAGAARSLENQRQKWSRCKFDRRYPPSCYGEYCHSSRGRSHRPARSALLETQPEAWCGLHHQSRITSPNPEPCEVGELQVWDIVYGSPVDDPLHASAPWSLTAARSGWQSRRRSGR
jgi:hypothetical protein